ncbi:MAG: Crp/Fnr family transcriptional regulator [Spirochaetales bacterium]|jgi:CRP-like cAMP-binding protein|nr:Crp/Fnr family transcriptional regulator [Spirochaetales bacterium]
MSINLEALERFAVDFGRGELIFSEFEPGDTFYLIQTGRVKIFRIIGDIEKTLDVLQPGEIFGEMAILEEAPRSANALALDPVKALVLNRKNFEVLMDGNPQIALKLLKLLIKRIYDQRRRFMILTLDNLDARVEDVFLMLAESEPAPFGDGQEREFHLTINEIAAWAGLPPEYCRNAVNRMVTKRRAEVFPDRIVVKNINELMRMVNSHRRAAEA